MDVGDVVEDFSLPDQTGTPRRLSEFLRNGPVALYFYPAAMTVGCSIEARTFRDRASEFSDLGAQRVGISPDPVDKLRAFTDRDQLDFPLLSDVDGAVATMLGARRKLSVLPTKRWTFVIDTNRKIIDVIKNELRMSVHADRALEVLQKHHDA